MPRRISGKYSSQSYNVQNTSKKTGSSKKDGRKIEYNPGNKFSVKSNQDNTHSGFTNTQFLALLAIGLIVSVAVPTCSTISATSGRFSVPNRNAPDVGRYTNTQYGPNGPFCPTYVNSIIRNGAALVPGSNQGLLTITDAWSGKARGIGYPGGRDPIVQRAKDVIEDYGDISYAYSGTLNPSSGQFMNVQLNNGENYGLLHPALFEANALAINDSECGICPKDISVLTGTPEDIEKCVLKMHKKLAKPEENHGIRAGKYRTREVQVFDSGFGRFCQSYLDGDSKLENGVQYLESLGRRDDAKNLAKALEQAFYQWDKSFFTNPFSSSMSKWKEESYIPDDKKTKQQIQNQKYLKAFAPIVMMPTPAARVPEEAAKFYQEMHERLNSEEDPFELSAWVLVRSGQIHMFDDGNGRIGRNLVRAILMRAGFPAPLFDNDIEYTVALESEKTCADYLRRSVETTQHYIVNGELDTTPWA
ncbi:MAG: hypothetical protein CMO81_00975 [Waddliaceae bacterium]|nr:hypothetical protein [Waddliaceae bacterium]